MHLKVKHRLQVYQATAIFSILFALIGFSYNVWRMEVSEENNTARTAAFEILQALGEFEEVVFLAHYDTGHEDGNPRKGWAKVIFIDDLSNVLPENIQYDADTLRDTWQSHWNYLAKEQESIDIILVQTDKLRASIAELIRSLD